ncbi:hypothetical protein FA13DRAFT_1794045 [Coprinellus micaceus]|uniref:Uncharacterized protein n=1 Tax=Coprinellus micaceus TaxID=71717 RepID=A0A4Y7T3W9_COPMI|nr:hypothetical protein FA13DRAFT_1794045 [Coprinellus micaceus]
MTTDGNDALCVGTLRGVCRASRKDFSYATTTLPDVVAVLSDTPPTNAPYS